MDVDTEKLRRELIARAEQLTPLPAAVTRLAKGELWQHASASSPTTGIA